LTAAFARTDRRPIARWWWTVDRWTLAALGTLAAIGAVLALAASPAVADRLGLESYYFVRRQLAVVPVAALVLFAVSFLGPRGVRRAAIFLLLGSVVGLVLTLVVGTEVKGARRWINLFGLSIQPSEFVKPAFAVVAAWLFTRARIEQKVSGNAISIALYATILACLLLQPDLGMAGVVTAVWIVQFVLAGLPIGWIALLGGGAISGMIGAYFTFSHVASRIDRFLNPATGDSYQITRALQAFGNGGLFGRGPGEGRVKETLPDAHTDFVFAVAGEEMGFVLCLALVGLFAFVVLRGFARTLEEENMFVMIAAAGLLTQFGLQAMINMASSLRLMPTKGMTLPFISFGGSSLLAIAIGMGFLLALTRRRSGLPGPQL
jgi:cell division protein FtsW